MANLVITSTVNTIIIVMNSAEAETGIKQSVWSKSHMDFSQRGLFVEVCLGTSSNFLLCYEALQGGLKVDSVDGVAPSSTDHLFNLLSGLLV